MLIAQSFKYVFARGLPGLINLLSLMLFTRLLSPQAYGEYALVMTGVGLVYVVLYQWLKLGILRHYPAYQTEDRTFLVSILTAYAIISLLAIFGAMVSLFFIDEIKIRLLLGLSTAILLVHAFHQLNLELTRIKLKPNEYAIYGMLKSTLSLSMGALFIWLGFEVFGVLGGLLLALLTTGMLGFGRQWYKPSLKYISRDIIIEQLRYGLPLTAVFALTFVISGSDRIIIGWMIDVQAAGLYSAGYDITNQSLGIIMVILNLAAYPLVVRTLEKQGEDEAKRVMSSVFTLLWAVALPCSVGIALLAEPVAAVFLGEQFRETAVQLIPIVAAATLLSGMKSYYFDLGFQLGKKTKKQIWSVLFAAIVNIVLNLLLIPRYGMMGAAYATLAAYAIALYVSYLLGKNVFKVPVPLTEMLKVSLATLVMAGVVYYLPKNGAALWQIFSAVVAGGIVYFCLILLLNVADSRAYIKKKILKAAP
jgi:O-antigen/teichoic acid export membrane protein